MTESGTFETQTDYLESAPSPKRARFEGQQPEIVSVSGDDGTVTITVPQTQFEIEINSQQEEEEDDGSPSREIHQIQAGDLAGPAFEVIHEAKDLLDDSQLQHSMDGAPSPGGGEPVSDTLNAIGALIQMQQQQTATGSPSQGQLVLTRSSSETEGGQTPTTPLYVMIPPSSSAEILQAMGQSRPIAPKMAAAISPNSSETLRANREAQRKATHNEVERRRRDRINELIKMLAQIVPGCQKKDATTGNIVGYVYSKGTVLDKTVEYLKDLISQNEQLATTAKLAEKSANALSLLQNQITVLEKENAFLRAQIIQFGIDAATASSNPPPSSMSHPSSSLLNSSLAQNFLNSIPSQPSQSTASATATQTAAQQLLLSLAQSLTNNPLLTSLTQSPAPSSLSSSPSPSRLPQQLPASLVYSTPSQLGSSPSNQTTPLLSSLVQTLASIANTTTTAANPLPKVSLPNLSPQGQTGLPAATAASLLNTLLLAQNMLTNAGAGNHDSSSTLAGSVLNSMHLEGGNTPQQ